MILVLLGAPGAGKGTQAEALSAATGAAHVATGDLFRAEIAAGSPLGLAAQQFIDAGQLVPDEVTINMIQARLAKGDAANRVILDGFPRNPAQASALDAAYAASGRSIRAVLLKVDDAILAERLTARRVCSSCGRSYTWSFGRTCASCSANGLAMPTPRPVPVVASVPLLASISPCHCP